MSQVESKVYSFSTTDKELQEHLDAWQKDKMFSPMINKTLKKYFKIE